MSISKLTISASVLFTVTSTNAQSNNNISWWSAFYLKYSINKKWSVAADIQTRNFAKQPLVGLLAFRGTASYSINKQWSVSFGTAWFHQQQINEAKEQSISDELRLYEELKNEWKINKWNLVNLFRTEQRYFSNQDGLAFRFRYRLAADYHFNEKWKVMAGNELMWQSSTTRSNWDQYRIWAGAEFAFDTHNQAQIIIMNWHQYSTAVNQPVVRINFIHIINPSL